MGQYFNAIFLKQDKDSVESMIRPSEDCRFGAKLTEHSWWFNEYVGLVCRAIYRNPVSVAWVGDYCESDRRYDKLEERRKIITGHVTPTLYESQNIPQRKVANEPLLLNGLFLVNHSQKQFLDCSKYFIEAYSDFDWCLHPLPLLTAIGNGNGGGDYFGQASAEYVGSWALDQISVEDAPPSDFVELVVNFKE